MGDSRNEIKFLKQQLNATLEASHDGLWIVDKNGRILNANRAAIRTTTTLTVEVCPKSSQSLQRMTFDE